jgi:hypothetical protein
METEYIITEYFLFVVIVVLSLFFIQLNRNKKLLNIFMIIQLL